MKNKYLTITLGIQILRKSKVSSTFLSYIFHSSAPHHLHLTSLLSLVGARLTIDSYVFNSYSNINKHTLDNFTVIYGPHIDVWWVCSKAKRLNREANKQTSWYTCDPLILPIHFLLINAKSTTKFIFYDLYYMGLSLKAHQDNEMWWLPKTTFSCFKQSQLGKMSFSC